MNTSRAKYAILVTLAALFLMAGCGGNDESAEMTQAGAQAMAEGQARTEAVAADAGIKAKVLETFASGGYTYLRVEIDGAEKWAAIRETDAVAGEEVMLMDGILMRDFHSSTLDRTFPEIWFYGGILRPGEVAAVSSRLPTTVNEGSEGHPEVVIDAGGIDFSGIEKPAGGMSVAEIHAAKGDLAGKEILVRGKVVKFTGNVMSRNWIHLRDGTGDGADVDLTITTDAVAKVGQTVLVSGVVAEDKDFGYGYHYEILVEEAKITVE